MPSVRLIISKRERRVAHLGAQAFDGDLVGRGDDDGTLDDVFEFADVAGK